MDEPVDWLVRATAVCHFFIRTPLGVFVARRSGFGCIVGVCIAVASVSAAGAADVAVKAPVVPKTLPAVDGLNGKAEAFGGSLAGDSFYGGAGSVSVPVAQQFGVQVDGLLAGYRGDVLGGAAIHAFWRDPAKGLLGFYADYLRWDRLGSQVGHVGIEGAYYMGRFTFEGIVGVESGNNKSAILGGVLERVDLPTRFFDKIDLAYYMTDNLKLAIGHRYYGGESQLALGGEWAFGYVNNVATSLFVEGRVGDNSSVWGGLRAYFGQKPKSLIKRHREDDPPGGLSDSAGGFGNGGSSSAAPPGFRGPLCPPPSFPLPGGGCGL